MEAEQDRHRQGVQDIDSQMEMSAQELLSLRDRLKQITEVCVLFFVLFDTLSFLIVFCLNLQMVTNQSMIVDSRSEQRLALAKVLLIFFFDCFNCALMFVDCSEIVPGAFRAG
jgi:hypothetical protein